jgi:hypothetical protein
MEPISNRKTIQGLATDLDPSETKDQNEGHAEAGVP